MSDNALNIPAPSREQDRCNVRRRVRCERNRRAACKRAAHVLPDVAGRGVVVGGGAFDDEGVVVGDKVVVKGACVFGTGGVVGGVLLGLGRALGETVAIFFVLNLVFEYNFWNILEPKGGSIASMILSKFGEATEAEISGLMAAGLVLFIVTLLVSLLATFVVNKAQPWRKL